MAKPSIVVLMAMALVATAATGGPGAAQATHKCDPVDPVSDVGWSVVPSVETVGEEDSAPYRAGAGGDWFVDRTSTLLPFCNYYNEIGIYSLRSYTLSPQATTQRIAICTATPAGGSVAIAPYAGSCPPR